MFFIRLRSHHVESAWGTPTSTDERVRFSLDECTHFEPQLMQRVSRVVCVSYSRGERAFWSVFDFFNFWDIQIAVPHLKHDTTVCKQKHSKIKIQKSSLFHQMDMTTHAHGHRVLGAQRIIQIRAVFQKLWRRQEHDFPKLALAPSVSEGSRSPDLASPKGAGVMDVRNPKSWLDPPTPFFRQNEICESQFDDLLVKHDGYRSYFISPISQW
jgi:hypothetical protein